DRYKDSVIEDEYGKFWVGTSRCDVRTAQRAVPTNDMLWNVNACSVNTGKSSQIKAEPTPCFAV
ncbi:MAG TPA: hypothetical protein VFC44_19845, partial [Candidatus Saccharimonadales bacterium]|nr:hypothetical protein [Candidatus Saccharimonadales bacterium]